MPNINDFVGKKNLKKGSEWSLPTISNQAATPQRRPGRGEDSHHLQSSQNAASKPSDTKHTTKSQQTYNKATTEHTTKSQQTYNKATLVVTPVSESKEETYNKLPTQPTTRLTTKSQQTYNKATTETAFLSLVGLQRRIVLFLYELCRSQGDRVTEAVSISNVALNCETTVRAAQETIRRLELKEFIRRAKYKNGRGGWTAYELPEGVYKELFKLESSNKLTTKLQQTPNKLPTELTTQLTTSSSSSSSFVLDKDLKTTTTGEPELFDDARVQLSPDWSTVDFSSLSEIGFTQTHLIQLAKHGKLTATEVEASIEFFSFDLKRNGKAKTLNGAPLNFFMGILRKGIPYAPPENFESPADEARRRTREVLERKARERQAEELRIFELEFSEWRRGLVSNDLSRLVPEWAQKPGQIQDSALKSYFEATVWPERAQDVLGLSKVDRAEISKQIDEVLGQGSTP